MALLDDIATRLQTAGVGTVAPASSWAIYKGFLPPEPDTAIALFQTPGMAPEQRWQLDYPGLQVRVRGEPWGYAAAEAKIQAAFVALHDQHALVGAAYALIRATSSGPLPLGQDESNRPELTWNFHIARTR